MSTMEWDVVYGDIEVEVTFHDWQVFNSIAYPMTVRMSLGGAPREGDKTLLSKKDSNYQTYCLSIFVANRVLVNSEII